MPIPITEQPKILPKVGDPIHGSSLKYEEADIANLGYVEPQGIQQTTTELRSTALDNSAKLDTKLGTLSGNQQITDANANAKETALAQTEKANIGMTGRMDYSDPAFPQGKRIQVDPATGKDIGPETTAIVAPKTQLETDIQTAKDTSAAQVKEATTTLDSLKGKYSAATDALIESVKKSYAQKIALMEESNSRLLAGKVQSGIRSGRSKYLNDIQGGILSDTEQAGISRVATLEADMASLISKAEMARTDKDLELFNKHMDLLNTSEKNLQTEVQNLQKASYDHLQEMRAQAKAEADAQKAEQTTLYLQSERAAPAIVTELNGLSPDKQVVLIEEYAKKTGIPIDVLMGDIQTEATKASKSALDIENIKSSIADRAEGNRIARANLAINQKKASEAQDDLGLSNIINGVSTLGDVADKDLEKVKTKLSDLGFYDETPPSWFVQAKNTEANATLAPDKIQPLWDTYRKNATGQQVESK